MDVFTALFSASNEWCGWDGCTGASITQDDMFRANLDNAPPNLPWVDHTLPATMMFAYNVLANSWYDFRNDPANDANYNLVQSYFQLTDAGALYTTGETAPPPSSSSLWWPYNSYLPPPVPPSFFYGDIDTTAMSPLHAVIPRVQEIDGALTPVAYLWSPDAP